MASPPASNIDIVVTVAADDDAASVAGRLRDAGMRVSETLAAAGVVTGAAPAAELGALRDLEGVLAVEPARDVQLPPPGAPQ